MIHLIREKSYKGVRTLRQLLNHYYNDPLLLMEAINSKKDIVKACKECGEEFIFTSFKQVEYDMMGFKHPKRCRRCLDKRNLMKIKSIMTEEQFAEYQSLSNLLKNS